MSDRDKAIEIVKHLPDDKIIFLLTYLRGLEDGIVETPNDETITAFDEIDKKISDGTLKPFSGSTKDFLNDLLAAED